MGHVGHLGQRSHNVTHCLLWCVESPVERIVSAPELLSSGKLNGVDKSLETWRTWLDWMLDHWETPHGFVSIYTQTVMPNTRRRRRLNCQLNCRVESRRRCVLGFTTVNRQSVSSVLQLSIDSVLVCAHWRASILAYKTYFYTQQLFCKK